MNLVLTRKQRRPDGIFSELRDEEGNLVAQCLEHAYPSAFPEGSGYEPKVPNGSFQCQRGMHRLEGMRGPFVTFEVTGVPGHSNILFHCGNYQCDSMGCVLLGQAVEACGPRQMITNSRTTFAQFMELQRGLDQFTLTVQG